MNKRASRVVAIALPLLLIVAVDSAAQSPEEKARIDYAAAKKALERNEPELALRKFLAVREVLGSLPELDVYLAKAAFGAGDLEAARKYVKDAFGTKEPGFRKSAEYQALLDLAAELELAEAKAKVAESVPSFLREGWAKRMQRRKEQMGPCFHEYSGYEVGAKWEGRLRATPDEVGYGRTTETFVESPTLVHLRDLDQLKKAPCKPDPMPQKPKVGQTWLDTPPGDPSTCTVDRFERITALESNVLACVVGCRLQTGQFRSTEERWYVKGVGVVRVEQEVLIQQRHTKYSFELVSYRVPPAE